MPQLKPFVVDDVSFMEGGGFRTIFIVPSKDLVIFRHGQDVPNWDHSYLVNAVLARGK